MLPVNIAPHSSFRTPLDDILRSPANLRVLRALGRHARTQPELRRETGLSKPSVSRSLQTLWDLGVLTTTGVGEPTAIRVEHPIAAALLRLLDEERERVEQVYEGLRQAFGPNAMSVWIEGEVARGADSPEDPLEVGVLVEARRLGRIRDSAESQIAEIEKAAAVMIDIRYYTRADLATMAASRSSELSAALPLSGIAPLSFAQGESKRQTKRTHADKDKEAIHRGRALAQLLGQDTTLVSRALGWVRDQLGSASPGVARSLHEWERILVAATPAQLRRLLADDSERATRLRQSNPFSPILSREERRKLRTLVGAE